MVQSSLFQLRLLAKVKSFLSFSDFEWVTHAFIMTGLHFYNAFCVGVSQACLLCLQLVQHAAAHLLTGKHRCEHERLCGSNRQHWSQILHICYNFMYYELVF